MDAAGERRRRRPSRRRVRAARERRVGRGRALPGRALRRGACGARSSSACATAGPFDDARAGRERRAPRHPVGRGLARRGHRHRPHRARLRRRGLRARRVARPAGADAGRRGGPLLRRLRLAARPLDGARPPTRSSATSPSAGFLVEAGVYEHRYPHCWRCDTPLIFRISDDWFIARRRAPRSRCSRRTRPSSGCPRTWASAWTTGCATWATGTSRAAATTACRCRSTRAPAGT